WLFAAWLVCQVWFLYGRFTEEEQDRQVAAAARGNFALPERSATPVVAHNFVRLYLVQQIFLLVLAAPAFAAGAVTDEKRRGTLEPLLTTALDARQVILGKLLGRSAQVASVALVGLPLFALCAGLAGLPPLAVLTSVVVQALPLMGLAAAA